MKFCKKLICIVFALFPISRSEVSAFFGNTHFNLGKKIIAESKIDLSHKEMNAFLAGLVYADIGYFKFDKQTYKKCKKRINSDDEIFAAKLAECAKTPAEMWFARGFAMHAFQDSIARKFLDDIFGTLTKGLNKKTSKLQYLADFGLYILNCGFLDYYFCVQQNSFIYNSFLDKFNSNEIAANIGSLDKIIGIASTKIATSILDNYYSSIKKESLILYDELIKQAYLSLGLNVTIEELHEQSANIIGAFVILSALNSKRSISKELANKIELKTQELVNECLSYLDLLLKDPRFKTPKI